VWPWEHVAVGYLLVSAATRLLRGRPPTRLAGVVAVGAALLPDLVDKPLSWGLAVLPSGRSLGHSILIAIPVVIVVAVAARAMDRRDLGLAFGLGYLSHLAGDVAYPLVVDGELRLGFLFWPIVPADTSGSGGGLPYLTELVAEFLQYLTSPIGVLYVAADLLLVGTALVVWLLDVRPLAGREDGWPADD